MLQRSSVVWYFPANGCEPQFYSGGTAVVVWKDEFIFLQKSLYTTEIEVPYVRHFHTGCGIFDCDSVKYDLILHWITMEYAVSHLKMPHVRDCIMRLMPPNQKQKSSCAVPLLFFLLHLKNKGPYSQKTFNANHWLNRNLNAR